jgi:hypothetical protein
MHPGSLLDVGGDAAGFLFDLIDRDGDFQLVPTAFY